MEIRHFYVMKIRRKNYLYGDIFILCSTKKDGKLIDFCVSDYGAIYELLFDGFDDCDYSDEEFSDETPKKKRKKKRMLKHKKIKILLMIIVIYQKKNITDSEDELDFDENDYTFHEY